MHQLFVYGTLRKGGISHHLLQGAPLLQLGVWLNGYSLYSAGWYPVTVADAAGRILGDVLAIPETLWPVLDAYEGEGYERHYLEEKGVWLYLYKGSINQMPQVAGGDWLQWAEKG